MKTTREKADELVEQYVKLLSKSYQYPKKVTCIQCAILSVKHTIEVLEKIQDKNTDDDIDNYHITMQIFEQTELLTELESRL